MASENDKSTSTSGKTAAGGAGGKDAGGGGKPASGARTKPVTIDLKAQEVRNEKAAAEAKAETAAKPAAGGPGAEQATGKAAEKPAEKTAATADKPDASAAAAKPGDKPAGDRPAGDKATAEAAGKGEAKQPGAAPAAKGKAPGGGASAGAQSGGAQSGSAQSGGGAGTGRMVLAAAVGGGIALGGAFLYGQVAGGPNVERVVEDLQLTLADTDSRFRQLEQQVTALKQVEAGPAVAPTVVEDLSRRLEELETSAAGVVEGAETDRQTTETLRADVAVLTDALAEIKRFISSGSAGESAALSSLSDTILQMESDVATLKTQVEGDVTERLAALESGADADAALKEALAGIEERMATLDGRINSAAEAASAAAKAVTEGDAVTSNSIAAFGERLDTLAAAVSRNAEEATGLDGRLVTTSMRADEFAKRLDELNGKLDALGEQIAEIETVVGGPGAREMAARAVAVSLLKSAVDSGRPYETELAAVRVALPPEADLSALDRTAADGLAPASRLMAQFPEVARVMAGTLEKIETGNSVVDKFLNNARSLVSVRSTGEAVGAGPMAALGHMEARVREGDLDGALEIYETLPDGTQAAGKDWAAAARGRLAADRLVDQVTADVIKALAASAS